MYRSIVCKEYRTVSTLGLSRIDTTWSQQGHTGYDVEDRVVSGQECMDTMLSGERFWIWRIVTSVEKTRLGMTTRKT